MTPTASWLLLGGVVLGLIAIYWIFEWLLPDVVFTPRQYREPMPPKPIWMSPEFYENKQDRAHVVPITRKRAQ